MSSGNLVSFDTRALQQVSSLCEHTARTLQEAPLPDPILPALGVLPAEAVSALIDNERQLRQQTATMLSSLRTSLQRTSDGLQQADRFVW